MASRACPIVVALFGASLCAIGTPFAQTPPPAAVPTPSCERPADPPRLLSTETGRSEAERKRNDWANKMKDYVDCLKRFIEDEQAAAAAHVKAVNAAVEEYNRAIKAYNDAQAAR